MKDESPHLPIGRRAASILFNTMYIYDVCSPFRAFADESESNYPRQPVCFFAQRGEFLPYGDGITYSGRKNESLQ